MPNIRRADASEENPSMKNNRERIAADGLTLRPARWHDVRDITRLLDTASRQWTGRATTTAQVNDRLKTPGTDMNSDTICIHDAERVLVGFGHLWPAHPEELRCFARTHPSHRGRGVGAALQRWATIRADDIARGAPIGPPTVLTTTSWPADAAVAMGVPRLVESCVRQAEELLQADPLSPTWT
jgi:GNAT superfamily N-acetyltransferase